MGVVIPDEEDDNDEYVIVSTPNVAAIDPPDSDRDTPNNTLPYDESSDSYSNSGTVLSPSQNVFSTPEIHNSDDLFSSVDASVPNAPQLLTAWNAKMSELGFENASIPISADLNKSILPDPDEEDLSGHASSF